MPATSRSSSAPRASVLPPVDRPHEPLTDSDVCLLHAVLFSWQPRRTYRQAFTSWDAVQKIMLQNGFVAFCDATSCCARVAELLKLVDGSKPHNVHASISTLVTTAVGAIDFDTWLHIRSYRRRHAVGRIKRRRRAGTITKRPVEIHPPSPKRPVKLNPSSPEAVAIFQRASDLVFQEYAQLFASQQHRRSEQFDPRACDNRAQR